MNEEESRDVFFGIREIDTPTRENLHFLLHAFQSEESLLRNEALEKLGEIWEGDNIPAEIYVCAHSALRDDDDLVRTTALEFWEEHPTKIIVQEILPFLDDESVLVCSQAGQTLGYMGDKSVMDAIRAVLPQADDRELVGHY